MSVAAILVGLALAAGSLKASADPGRSPAVAWICAALAPVGLLLALGGAIGVAVAQTKRPILCLSGDGSSMYSIQALWTAAHHDLPIVFIILANREYRVLKHNIDAYRARFDVKSNKPYMHMDLGGPTMGFVDMARGMGVAGTYVSKADDIKAAVAAAFKSGKPHLIEVEIEGKR